MYKQNCTEQELLYFINAHTKWLWTNKLHPTDGRNTHCFQEGEKTRDSTVNYKTWWDKNKWMMCYEIGKDNWVEAQTSQTD